MSFGRTLARLLLTGLLVCTPALTWAQGTHPEEGHQTHTLSLNQGEKWETDAPLRQGMSDIRNALVAASDAAGSIPAEDYDELATSLEREVDYMIANCELPADADAQHHILLEQILGDVEAMRSDAPQRGAVEMAHALEAYGDLFRT